MCACRCGIRVHLKDGALRYIDGNPNHPINKGVICAKGAAGIMKQASPARLTRPLLRKAGSERGAGEFEADLVGARVRDPDRAARDDPRQRSAQVRLVHRTRPDAGAHGPLRAPVRHAQLRGTRRLLLGQHGRGNDLHDRRQLLGIRRPGPRARQAVRDDRHRRGPSFEPAQDRDRRLQAQGRPLHLDQPGAHRLLGDRRRVDSDPTGHRRRALHGAAARADRERPDRPRVPEALHQRAPARRPRRRRARRHVRPRSRSGQGPAGRRPAPAQQADLRRGVAHDQGGVSRRHRRGVRSGARGRLRAGRRHPRGTVVPAPARPRRAVHAGVGGSDHRHRRGAHQEARARARRDRAASGVRAADRLDRRLGHAPRDDAGPAGRLPRDARPGGAFQRLSDGARAGGADERARHDRCARRLSPQGAVSAPHRAELPRLQLARHDQAEHAAQRCAARLSRQPRGARDRGRRHADADRPCVLVGAPAVGARPDAHGDHERDARRPLPARHAPDLHVEHGVELDHEHGRGARDAQPQECRRRARDPVPRRLRCVPQRDGRLRRPRPARHDVSRAPRRDEHARPADLRVRRACRFGPRPGRSAERASASRSRTCWSSWRRA